MEEKVVIGILSALVGAIGALFAPWIKWGFEKRRKRYEERKQLINKLRAYVESETFSTFDFVETSIYSQFKPYLKRKMIEHIERVPAPNNTIAKFPRSYNTTIEFKLLEAIRKLEMKWGII